MIYANLKPYDPTLSDKLNTEFTILEDGRYLVELTDIKQKPLTIDGVEKEVYWFKVLDEAYYDTKVFLSVFTCHKRQNMIAISQNLLANFIAATGNDLGIDTQGLIGSRVLADVSKYEVKEKVGDVRVGTGKFANKIMMFFPYDNDAMEAQEQSEDDDEFPGF